jgi:chemotaxis protein methyltransferase CheR
MSSTTRFSEDLALVGGVAINDREFQLFRNLIYRQTGISLRDSKTTMLSARLSKRLRQLNLNSFEAYYQMLQSQGPESDEFRQMINAVTTNKTSFFRENHHFEFLATQLKHRKTPGSLRIWSAACSTGQEPYSIAITVAEAFGTLQGRDIRILASDIDTKVLHTASEGVYDVEALADMPTALQNRYLRAERSSHGPRFRMDNALRDVITFRHKNLIAPSWGINTKFDFIFCRNVLIYFDHDTQDQILRKFIGFLKPQCYLIVGHSEHLHWLNALIEPVGRTIYRVKGISAK